MSDMQEVALEALGDELETRVINQMPKPEFGHILDMDVNLRSREIFVCDVIEEEFAGWFIKTMRYLQRLSDDPIVIWINTPGGDETAMMAFHDVVRASRARVTTIGVGQVCSAGVLMLACGHERLVTENCVLMSHESRGLEGVELRYGEAKERRKWADWLHERWFELMARYTEPNASECNVTFWRRKTEKSAEYWLLGGEAIISKGIADLIYRPELLPEPARSCYPIPVSEEEKS